MTSARFPKSARLLTAAHFDAAFKAGRRVKTAKAPPGLAATAAPNTLDHPRLGFALSKRHAKTAVQRNRIKRQLRERFRLHSAQLKPYDIAVFLRAKAPSVRETERADIERLWQGLVETCARS